VSGITEQLILDIKVLGARQAALEAKMVNDEVGGVGTTTEKAGKQAEKSASNFAGLGTSFKSLAKLGAAAGLAFGIKDIISAGVDWQKQQVQLQGALKKTGNYSEATMNHLEKVAANLSEKGGFAETANLGAIQQFTQETGKSSLAVRGLSAATDLARGAGLSLTQTQKYIGMAMAGSTGRLNKYLGALIPVTTHVDNLTSAQRKNWATYKNAELLDKQATATMILDKIQKKFGGDTARYNKTAAAAVSNLHNAVVELAEKMGAALLPALTKIVTTISHFILTHKKLVEILLASLAAILAFEAAVKIAKGVMKVWTDVTKLAGVVQKGYTFIMKVAQGAQLAYAAAQGTATAATEAETAALAAFDAVLDALGIGLIIAAIAALVIGIIELIKHFNAVKKNVIESFTAVWSFLKAIGPKILDVITWPWRMEYDFVVGVFKKVITFFKGLPATIAKLAVKIWDALKHGVSAAVNWIVKQIEGIPGKLIGGVVGIGKKIIGGIGSIGSSVGHFFGLNKGGVVPRHFSSGGYVIPGSGTYDSVPAMLTPGEGVLSVAAMKAINSRGFNIPTVGTGNAPEVIATGPMQNIIMMDTRKVAEEITRYQLKIAARR
jgi:hypothetical protein